MSIFHNQYRSVPPFLNQSGWELATSNWFYVVRHSWTAASLASKYESCLDQVLFLWLLDVNFDDSWFPLWEVTVTCSQILQPFYNSFRWTYIKLEDYMITWWQMITSFVLLLYFLHYYCIFYICLYFWIIFSSIQWFAVFISTLFFTRWSKRKCL